MEAGLSVYHLWVIQEPPAALSLHLFSLIQRGEDPIDHRLVGERPESLGRLHLGSRGRQEDPVEADRGSVSRALQCHPARSSTSTICWSAPAPLSWANTASAWENTSVFTGGKSSQRVSPLWGWTQA